MITHIVLFKFKESTTSEQKEAVIFNLRSLKDEIPGIIDLKAGLNVSDKHKGFEIGLSILFNDKKALEQYGPHPKHQNVVTHLKDNGLLDMIIFDLLE